MSCMNKPSNSAVFTNWSALLGVYGYDRIPTQDRCSSIQFKVMVFKGFY
uniref:Uncharacterized protein n=1 Tax=Anguilla anguilla TaxID=7936 RepID=A0A0E9UJV9_ANGAN